MYLKYWKKLYLNEKQDRKQLILYEDVLKTFMQSLLKQVHVYVVSDKNNF